MPSSRYALLVSRERERSTFFDDERRLVTDASGGVGMLQSSYVEFEEKRKQKRVALSEEETAEVSVTEWEKRRQGSATEIVSHSPKEQKDLLVMEEERLSHFLWIKECFISQITFLQ